MLYILQIPTTTDAIKELIDEAVIFNVSPGMEEKTDCKPKINAIGIMNMNEIMSANKFIMIYFET